MKRLAWALAIAALCGTCAPPSSKRIQAVAPVKPDSMDAPKRGRSPSSAAGSQPTPSASTTDAGFSPYAERLARARAGRVEQSRGPRPKSTPPVPPPAVARADLPKDCAGILTLKRDGSVDAGAINRVLAFRVYRHLAAKEPKNFVFSPLALQLTLAKLMRTLDRSDARRIARTLCLSEPPPPTFESALEAQIARWKALSASGIDLRFGTRAFGTALPAALAGFESESVDPMSARGSARIEQWMQAVVGERVATPAIGSKTALGAAVAFQGDWSTPFWRGPHTINFHLGSGAVVRAPGYLRGKIAVSSNYTRHPYNYLARKVAVLSLPYETDQLALLMAMPSTSLGDFEEHLEAAQLGVWDASLMRNAATWVSIPRLRIRTASSLACCGLEWVEQRVGPLIQATALMTRNRNGPPSGRIDWSPDPTFQNMDMLAPFILMVRSRELILLMGRLVDPR